MEKLLLLLLLKEQTAFENKYLSLLDIKTKQEYTKNIFLKKQNKLLWSLCKEEIRLYYIPAHCWKLEKQWTRYSLVTSVTRKPIFSLLNQLCTKNVTLLRREKALLKVNLKSLSVMCAKKVKYSLKTVLYRKKH